MKRTPAAHRVRPVAHNVRSLWRGTLEACMMNCHECKDRLSDYIDGALATGPRRELEQHARECADCGRDLREMRQLVGGLSRLETQRLPDAFTFEMRRALADEAEREKGWLHRFRQVMRPHPQTVWAAAVGTAAALVVLVVGTQWSSDVKPGPAVTE